MKKLFKEWIKHVRGDEITISLLLNLIAGMIFIVLFCFTAFGFMAFPEKITIDLILREAAAVALIYLASFLTWAVGRLIDDKVNG